MDQLRSTWIPLLVEKIALEDEADIFQYGESDEDEFYRLNFYPAKPSFRDKWPTQD